MRRPRPRERLHAEPRRFGFDAAVDVLLHASKQPDPAKAARFRSPSGLGFLPADVLDVEPGRPGAPPQVTVSAIGLTGPAGVLPRHYTEAVTVSLRQRSRALHDFTDMLAHRFVALFARAGAKYRPHRAATIEMLAGSREPDPVARALLAFTGYATAHLRDRLDAGTDPLLHYAGLFATRPRSAERLAALASDWLGQKVEVLQFVGAWLPLRPGERTCMPAHPQPGRWNRLGVDAAIGTRAWDVQARIVLRIGPLTRDGFEALLPDRPLLRRLVSLVRAFVGFETGFAVNPVLSAAAVPAFSLDPAAAAPPRLGWNTWMPSSTPRRQDAAEAMFDAETVEHCAETSQ